MAVFVPFEIDAKMRQSPRASSAAAGMLPEREPAGDAPVDRVVKPVNRRPADLGQAGVEQIGPNGGRRVNPEQQHKERRHQRTAADAGEADQRADGEAGRRVERVDQMKHVGHGIPSG